MRRQTIVLILGFAVLIPFSSATAKIVISELLWSGTDLSTADEWIELTNTGTGTVDLTNWILTKLSNGTEEDMMTMPQGSTLASGATLLISNFDEKHSRLGRVPDIVDTSVSLANSQLLLKLYSPGEGTGRLLIDSVDDGIGAPFAGRNEEPKASMERIDLTGSGQLKENWNTATTFFNFDDGANLFGTPGAPNAMGPSVDTFPPKEAEQLSAEVLHGSGVNTLQISWIPSISLDLASQTLSFDPAINGSSRLDLPASATGTLFTSSFGSGTGILFTLRSTDTKGNTSSGAITISRSFPNVKITEVLANPKGGDDNEWIEIGNLGSEAVNIAGWILDEGNSPDNYVLEPQTGTSFLLKSQEHVSFPKSLTGLPLDNQGEKLTLTRGFTVMDTWAYSETAEEVSYGRDVRDPETFRAFCVPTEGKPNENLSSNPQIVIQSGSVSGEGSVSINLAAEVMTGSTTHAACHWNYGDGFTSDSCNPPSHLFDKSGTYSIQLTYSDFCGDTSQRTVTVTVAGSTNTSQSPQTLAPSNDGGSGSRGRGGGGGGGGGGRSTCRVTTFDSIRLSEFIPNPLGSDEEGEWIELENTNVSEASLCGWELDDAPEGSRPYPLDSYSIPGKSFLLLPRENTKIAINNNDEEVRLLAPGGGQADRVSFTSSQEGESFALRDDGLFVWTPFPTPGTINRFRGAERRFPGDLAVISAALPNPEGEDTGNEWIEVTNVGEKTINLSTWQLDNRQDSRKPYVIENITLQPRQVHRFGVDLTGITLTNTSDQARLLDPDGNIVSLLSWEDAASGRVYLPWQAGEREEALVIDVIDGDTLRVTLEGQEELVRLIGVDTPETVHPSKPVERFGKEASEFTRSQLSGKKVTLLYDEQRIDKYNRLLAYVLRSDGTNFNGELLRLGYAYAYLRFPFALTELFRAYEEEARKAKLGLWADEEVVKVVDELKQEHGAYGIDQEEDSPVQEEQEKVEAEKLGDTSEDEEDSGEGVQVNHLQEVHISEVMSNPPKEGFLHELGEYLELHNPTNETGSLAGLVLDDKPDGSSKPFTFKSDAIIAPKQYLLLCDGTGCHLPLTISLNNEGEEVSLHTASGTLISSLTYPKLDRGESYALLSGTWHTSLLATPGEGNILRTAKQPIKKLVAKKKTGGVKARDSQSLAALPDPLPSIRTKYRPLFHPDDQEKEEKPDEPSPLLLALLPQMQDSSLPPMLSLTGSNEAGQPLREDWWFLAISAACMLGLTAFSRLKSTRL